MRRPLSRTATAGHFAPRNLFIGASHASDKKLNLYTSGIGDGLTFSVYAAGVYNPSGEFVRDPTLKTWQGTNYMFHTRGPTGGDFGTTTMFGIAKCVGDPTVGGNWSDVGSVTISGANRVWAPQPFIDGDTLRVYVSVSTDGGTTFDIYETHNTGSDLTTGWSAATALGLGPGNNYIDAFMLKDGSTYEMWLKNGSGGYIEVFTSSSPASGFSALHTGNWAGLGGNIEDPCLVQVNQGTWRLYVDAFNALKIRYSESTDERATWSALADVTEPHYMQGFSTQLVSDQANGPW